MINVKNVMRHGHGSCRLDRVEFRNFFFLLKKVRKRVVDRSSGVLSGNYIILYFTSEK